jgi:IS30 family transposase
MSITLANDSVYPRHCECDLIKGSVNRSAVGVFVEHSLALVMLSHGWSVLEDLKAKLHSDAEPIRKTLTNEQRKEMVRHADLTANTGLALYFCDPHTVRGNAALAITQMG